ncbi:asparagine synthase (glutamine-hydrolyzing) [Butyrivibrio sp. XB500-5]|uniref:asparagine synthase (glutamine-hydrolyzing) n=1 Tax=Butyrivibrio sp. XB500-5 TaxID=2364880 RepID=UPI000EA99074|nr:asparagine synthase (glutamine-hydrolyzing) [Butyrivibrio sp. XB500-5]RKM59526.1 asparagine synthase (glutamine-hydrolyzing) [Butyrivibrio sp. XB500-5]
MCGICGGNDIKRDYAGAIEIIKHRGPDGIKVERYNDVTLCFCRLSIIDLSEGAMQPMSSNDGKVHIVFNGEIYGYKELRDRLKRDYNYKFMTTSDTEIILALYSIYGQRFVDYIDGMFAIAIYDERSDILSLYRDRVGIKPLYYYYDGKKIMFSSELKALRFMLDSSEKKIDKSALYDFFSYGYVPDPKTPYCNVFKLNPGSYIKYNLKKNTIIEKNSYWGFKINTKKHGTRNINDIQDEYRFLVNESVRDQLVADVPVGVFFSGGVDSSIIAYESRSIHENIKTYSIGFKESKYSEDTFISKFANELNVANHLDILGMDELNEEIYMAYADWFDEPYDDLTAIPTYLLSRQAVKNVKVALSGDGNDELFGGYSHQKTYYDWEKRGIKEKIKYSIEKNISGSGLLKDVESGLLFYASMYGCIPDKYRKIQKRDLGLHEDYDEYWFIRENWNTELPTYSRARYADFKTYLVGDILPKTDRSSMAVSLEVRVPFLSKKLVEFAFSLAEEECNAAGEMKAMVKTAYKGDLSEELLYRQKHGFTIPHTSFRSTKIRGFGRRYCLYRDFWVYMSD